MDIERIHLAGISKDTQFIERLAAVAKIFEFNTAFFESCEKLSETIGNSRQIAATVLSLVNVDNLQEIAGNVQVIKYCSPDTVVLLVLKSKLSTENSEFIKKSGVYLIIDETDFYETSFVEYLLSQVIRGALIPMKYHDIHPDTAVDFKVLTIMPLNQKILPIVHPGSVITIQKMEKLKQTKEIYISRDEVDKVHKYSVQNRDKTKDSTIAKCRLKYLDLCRNHSELIFSLYDKSNTVTYSSGKKLLERCSQLAKELLSNLSELKDPYSFYRKMS